MPRQVAPQLSRPSLSPETNKYGEPEVSDGLSTLFIVLAAQATKATTLTERQWLAALEGKAPGSRA